MIKNNNRGKKLLYINFRLFCISMVLELFESTTLLFVISGVYRSQKVILLDLRGNKIDFNSHTKLYTVSTYIHFVFCGFDDVLAIQILNLKNRFLFCVHTYTLTKLKQQDIETHFFIKTQFPLQICFTII